MFTRHCRYDSSCPLPHRGPPPQPQQPQYALNQTGWQPHPSNWMPNLPAASSVWDRKGWEYMSQYNQQQQQPTATSLCIPQQSFSSLLNSSSMYNDDQMPPTATPSTTTADVATATSTIVSATTTSTTY